MFRKPRIVFVLLVIRPEAENEISVKDKNK